MVQRKNGTETSLSVFLIVLKKVIVCNWSTKNNCSLYIKKNIILLCLKKWDKLSRYYFLFKVGGEGEISFKIHNDNVSGG